MSAPVAVALFNCPRLVKQLEMATATSADITMEPVLLLLWTSLDLTDVPWPTILTTLVTTTFGIRSTASHFSMEPVLPMLWTSLDLTDAP